MADDFSPWSLAEAPIKGAFDYAGGKAQADAAKYAADKQTAAANHAADLEDAANQRAEAFQREQAQYTAQQAEVDRKANYDQTQARLQRLGSIGNLLGFHVNTQMPAYVPGVAPNFSTGGPTTPAPPSVGGAIDPAQIAAVRARMAGNTGVFNPNAPKLQPDGTYAVPPRPPLQFGSIGSYLQ